jgi:hypothetical protein
MEPNTQLELFVLPDDQTKNRGRLSAIGFVRIRQDHAVLFVIGGLIGISVVFAFGVERGKLLSKAEQALLLPSLKAPINTSPVEPSISLASAEATTAQAQQTSPAKKAVPKPPQFAIQVVSYRQAQLAQKELDRLKRRGEPAFVLQRQGKAALLVGPFATKQTASEKLVSLRALYHDCFLKNL